MSGRYTSLYLKTISNYLFIELLRKNEKYQFWFKFQLLHNYIFNNIMIKHFWKVVYEILEGGAMRDSSKWMTIFHPIQMHHNLAGLVWILNKTTDKCNSTCQAILLVDLPPSICVLQEVSSRLQSLTFCQLSCLQNVDSLELSLRCTATDISYQHHRGGYITCRNKIAVMAGLNVALHSMWEGRRHVIYS